MSKTKSQQTYDLLKKNQVKTYTKFIKAHQDFSSNPDENRGEFNRIGRDFVSLVRAYERRLCGGMEKSNNSVYSAKVSEKYWQLIREEFPLIDQVGVVSQ